MLQKVNEKEKEQLNSKLQPHHREMKNAFRFLIACVVMLLVFIELPSNVDFSAKITTAIIGFGVVLWALEPIPLGLTALLILLLFLLFQVADHSVLFSGFASPAIYLIIAGMMLANAVNETNIIKRMTYLMIRRWGSTANGLVGCILIIMQVQAFFIPATAVRATLMLPIASMIVKTVRAKPNSALEKLILLTVAFGGNISGTAILTAAIGNILTVELLAHYTNTSITYFQWFLYTFPIWLLLVPAIWLILIKLFPLKNEERFFPKIEEEMNDKMEQLGPITTKEIRCILILLFTVGLWLAEPVHHMHPVVPAIIGVILMTIPSFGVANWEKVVQINYNTVLLLGVTLSMGYVFIDSGGADMIGTLLSVPWILDIMQNQVMAIIFIILFTQVFHKLISNVSTAVVTLIPIIVSIAENAQVSPLILGFTAGLSSLFGFVLVVETMPNLIVHSTGQLSQKDFIKPGIYATLTSMIVMIVVALSWWTFLHLL